MIIAGLVFSSVFGSTGAWWRRLLEIRLESNGAIMVSRNGEWRYVCDDYWDMSTPLSRVGSLASASPPRR